MNNDLTPVIVQNDNKVFIELTCLDQNGAARDLTGATVTAKFSLNKATPISPACAILGTPTDGKVRVTLLSTDIPAAGGYGRFELQITATWADGTVKTSSTFTDFLRKVLA